MSNETEESKKEQQKRNIIAMLKETTNRSFYINSKHQLILYFTYKDKFRGKLSYQPFVALSEIEPEIQDLFNIQLLDYT